MIQEYYDLIKEKLEEGDYIGPSSINVQVEALKYLKWRYKVSKTGIRSMDVFEVICQPNINMEIDLSVYTEKEFTKILSNICQ